ncbi:TenA family transcriptional regulator [Sulfolobus acidocaldarius SUSAZ]|nr:TenA family transcriptional regulator [Sulfolobus acidocaldarius SUSAZ]
MLKELRQELSNLNEKILNHPFILRAESGDLPLSKLELFYDQQWYIVNYDLRSLAIMVSRANQQDELDFFLSILQGDYEGLKILREVAKKTYSPLPSAISYTHYLSWLANYGNPGEQAVALTVNLPVWADNCRRLANAFKGKADVRFLDLFVKVKIDDDQVETIVSRYLGRYKEISTIIQFYELQFWNSLL